MKKILMVIITITIIVSCVFCVFISAKKENYNIGQYQDLWLLYDQYINNIKNNFTPITVDSDDSIWWEFADFNIDDETYRQTLNTLLSFSRMCYIEYTDDGYYYTNSNPIRKYRNEKTITNKDLNILADNMSNDSCLTRFEVIPNLVISSDKNQEQVVLNKVNSLVNYYKTSKKESPTYYDLLVNKVIEVSMISDLSAWLNSEYYRLKK